MASGLENIETIESPFRRFVTTIGVFPTAFTDAMTYYECLAYLVKYLDDSVVPAVNENAEALKELQDYVVHYFDNLDIQDEINNKLDQMAEDGTLQEIIGSYLQANVAWTFDTVSDMKASTNLVAGSFAQTLGFHAIGDGGGAIYKISNTGTANEMNIIAVGSLFANLVSDRINLKQYGLYGDGTHDDTSMLNTILGNLTDKSLVYIPKGTYLCETDINVTANDIRIYGDGQLLSTIDFNNNGSVVFNGHGIKLDNIQFKKHDKIELDSYHNTINNVNFYQGNYGLLLKKAYITEIDNSYFTYNKVGLIVDDEGYEVVVSNSVIDNNELGILVTGSSGLHVNNCTIEGNRNTTSNIGCGVALATTSLDVSVENCWFEANGTSSDSADVIIMYDLEDGTLANLYNQISSLYAFSGHYNAGSLKLNNNHHLFTQYGVATGGYQTEVYISHCYFKGIIDKYNKPVLLGARNNALRYNKVICKGNNVTNTDNQSITTQMLNGIKGSYIYTNATIPTADYPALLSSDYYVLDDEPLFVYMPFIKNLSTVKYIKQWQSGGTAYKSGMLYGNETTSYPTISPAVYLTTDGTSGTINIFDATGDTTYSFIQGYTSVAKVRRDSNVVQTTKPLAEGYMEIRKDNLYNQTAFEDIANGVVFALVVFNADEIKASKQCIAMKAKDYYPSFIPSLS